MKFEDVKIGMVIQDNDPRCSYRKGAVIEKGSDVEHLGRVRVNWGTSKTWVRPDRIGTESRSGYTVIVEED